MVISNIKFPIYGMLIVISILLGSAYIYFSLKKEKVDLKNIGLYYILLVSFSLVFGKIFTAVTNPEEFNVFTAGLSSYGGLVGLVLSSYIFEKILPMDNKLIKSSIIALPLIYAVGKFACFFAGCCYGIPYNGFFSVTYVDGLNISLFPVQLVETLVFIIIFMICHRLRENYNIIYIVFVLYVVFKFLLDFLRYDHVNVLLTVNQIFSIILFLVVVIFYCFSRIKKSVK